MVRRSAGRQRVLRYVYNVWARATSVSKKTRVVLFSRFVIFYAKLVRCSSSTASYHFTWTRSIPIPSACNHNNRCLLVFSTVNKIATRKQNASGAWQSGCVSVNTTTTRIYNAYVYIQCTHTHTRIRVQIRIYLSSTSLLRVPFTSYCRLYMSPPAIM